MSLEAAVVMATPPVGMLLQKKESVEAISMLVVRDPKSRRRVGSSDRDTGEWR